MVTTACLSRLDSMLSNLPDDVQRQILTYLETQNFQAAKELRDQWLAPDETGRIHHHHENVEES
jgi:hypothetical protein